MLRVEVRVKGHIDQDWSEWLNGLTITHTEENATLLTGALPDQAALYGLLAKLWNLGLCLVSVIVAEVDEEQVKLSPQGLGAPSIECLRSAIVS